MNYDETKTIFVYLLTKKTSNKINKCIRTQELQITYIHFSGEKFNHLKWNEINHPGRFPGSSRTIRFFEEKVAESWNLMNASKVDP